MAKCFQPCHEIYGVLLVWAQNSVHRKVMKYWQVNCVYLPTIFNMVSFKNLKLVWITQNACQKTCSIAQNTAAPFIFRTDVISIQSIKFLHNIVLGRILSFEHKHKKRRMRYKSLVLVPKKKTLKSNKRLSAFLMWSIKCLPRQLQILPKYPMQML